mgnify:FL=1
MNPLVEQYLQYVVSVKRYSPRTSQIYSDVLGEFSSFSLEQPSDDITKVLTNTYIRNYEVHLLDERHLSSRTVNQHISVLSGFCRYLMTQGLLKSNPVKMVTRPKTSKRLPEFYREDTMEEYFSSSAHSASADELDILRTFGPDAQKDRTAREMYERRLRRMIISMLHSTGIRRAELISMDVGSVDLNRRVAKVLGKGSKTRMVPLVPSLCSELELYSRSVEIFFGCRRQSSDPLLLTATGKRLYPVFVDRAVKEELGSITAITGRKSPHVLRHTLATELLDEGADLNSIKELLGHSSLAATQVYTHNSAEKLKKVYEQAHPRAKK